MPKLQPTPHKGLATGEMGYGVGQVDGPQMDHLLMGGSLRTLALSLAQFAVI